MNIRDILKQRLNELLEQRDAIVAELEQFEELLAANVYEQLVMELTSSVIILNEEDKYEHGNIS